MDRILTVVTPATSKDMTSLAAVKTQLKKITSGDDALLNAQIAMASRAVANLCNGEFIAEEVSEQFRPYPFIDSASMTHTPEFIRLQRIPVIEIGTLTEDGVELTEGTDFEADYSTGRLTRLNSDMPILWHFRKLVVQYTGGYVFPGSNDDSNPRTLEPDLEQAVIEIVKDMWFASQRDPLLRAEDQPGLGRQEYWIGAAPGTMDDGWPLKVTALLAPWQRAAF